MENQRWAGTLPIFYRTLTIHQADLASPFNNWRQEHIRQGFTWRPGSVSFGTLDPDTITESLLVELNDSYTPSRTARRVIKVPFEVGSAGVEVTSPVSYSWTLAIPPGQYTIFFAIEPDDTATQETYAGASQAADAEAWRYHLTLVPTPEPATAEIIRADKELDPPATLLMEAEPA